MKHLISFILIFLSLTSSANEAAPKSDMLGLRTTVYMVNDIEAAKKWYTQAFGIKPYFDEPYYVGYNIRGFELGLMPTEKEQQTSGVISYWGVEDIEAKFKKLISLGATPLSPISDVGGGIKLGVVTDPFGNPLGVIYNPLFKNK
ncbi:Glyoxalase-like domain protein [Pseudoalteromonas sp. P1-9]|uniref:VOC family protein n=1 Tax=Pseudoalteromonas sp. P1-9 TaxID=1710354 RepID=UPI000707CD7D|nr:VOC family protein [Pseudoalteromonas sp. P1-9]KPV93589.1 Glyoxalase-like domain protein [Pseudoalteromonas sp. P1-9]